MIYNFGVTVVVNDGVTFVNCGETVVVNYSVSHLLSAMVYNSCSCQSWNNSFVVKDGVDVVIVICQ